MKNQNKMLKKKNKNLTANLKMMNRSLTANLQKRKKRKKATPGTIQSDGFQEELTLKKMQLKLNLLAKKKLQSENRSVYTRNDSDRTDNIIKYKLAWAAKH